MADNVNITVQDTLNEIVVNAAVIVETIDINVQVAVDEVQIIANPNNYVVNINRIIGEQVQSDWTQNDDDAPDYIKNKPILATVATSGDYTDLSNTPTIPTLTSDLINDGEDGVNPFITVNDIPPITGFVPYTGADQDVDLGTHDLTATQGTFATSGNPDTLTVNHSSGSGKALTITKGGNGEGIYVNKTSGSGNAVTIIGDLEATNLKRTGGTSAQFLKANGSVDSNTYFQLPALTSGSVLFSNGTTIAQDNAQLFWDDTNNRLGIGTATPTALIDARGSVRATGPVSTTRSIEMLYDESVGSMIRTNVYTLIHLVADTNKLATFQSTGILFPPNSSKLIGNTNRNLIEVYSETTGKLTAKTTQAWNLELGTNDIIRQTIFGSTGNVLINTTTDAGFKLDVNGTARVQGNAQFGTGFYWDNANGRLGIGTNAPAYGLDINGTTRVSGALTIGGSTTIDVAAATNKGISLTNGVGGSDFAKFALVGGGSNDSYIGAITNNNFRIYTQNTERVRFGFNGNVLINTTTDAGFKLDVNGTARVSGNTAINSGSEFFSLGAIGRKPFRLFTANGDKGCFRLERDGVINVNLSSDSTQFGASYISNTNFLVGTTTDAGFKLDVNGTARVSGTTTISPAALTGNAATSALDIAQTWNTTGTPIAFKLNITDTASASLSDLMSLQVGGSVRFRVLKSGYFVHNTGGEITGALIVGGNSINASARLQVDSLTQGFLPPRMTTTQKNAIATPATGLMVYDNVLNRPCFYDGTTWITL